MKLAKLAKKIRRAIVRDDPDYYDMFENKGEIFLGSLYLHEIFKQINAQHLQAPLNILDAGCQSGRLSIPLAKAGHQVTGVDISLVGLTRAKRHVAAEKVEIHLVRSDLSRWLPIQRAGSFDVVICTEVLYLRPNYKTLLEGLLRLLKPGGLCFVSHRPSAYYLTEALQRKDWAAVQTVLSKKEGTLFDGSYYNWQDREDLAPLYAGFGVEPLAIVPIGFFAWLAVNPGEFDAAEQQILLQAETDPRYASNPIGRYLLFGGRKKPE